jgi:hypothetical protein
MSDDRVHASPQDVRKLAVALSAYQQEVTAAGRKMQGALGAANWHDAQKDKFEARYRDLQRSIDRFMSSEVTGMITGLNELARRLAEISSMRL